MWRVASHSGVLIAAKPAATRSAAPTSEPVLRGRRAVARSIEVGLLGSLERPLDDTLTTLILADAVRA